VKEGKDTIKIPAVKIPAMKIKIPMIKIDNPEVIKIPAVKIPAMKIKVPLMEIKDPKVMKMPAVKIPAMKIKVPVMKLENNKVMKVPMITATRISMATIKVPSIQEKAKAPTKVFTMVNRNDANAIKPKFLTEKVSSQSASMPKLAMTAPKKIILPTIKIPSINIAKTFTTPISERKITEKVSENTEKYWKDQAKPEGNYFGDEAILKGELDEQDRKTFGEFKVEEKLQVAEQIEAQAKEVLTATNKENVVVEEVSSNTTTEFVVKDIISQILIAIKIPKKVESPKECATKNNLDDKNVSRFKGFFAAGTLYNNGPVNESGTLFSPKRWISYLNCFK
jgi:hypothetical protein